MVLCLGCMHRCFRPFENDISSYRLATLINGHWKPGDLIVAIDGIPVRTAEDVVRVITEQLYPGETAHLTILRGGERLALDVVLGERPSTVP